jgi:hypothetical protein
MTLGNEGRGSVRWTISLVLSFVLGVSLMSLAGEILHRARVVAQLSAAGSARAADPGRAERTAGSTCFPRLVL